MESARLEEGLAKPTLLPPSKLMLLLSAPRSGSTILAHVLANTGRIYCESEAWILLALEQFGRINLRSEYGSWHVAKATEDFVGTSRDRLMEDVARLIYASKLPPGREFFLDKTPRYYWIIPFIRRLFPDEKIIVLERNPLDIAASFKTTWGVDLTDDVALKNGETVLFDLFIGLDNIRKLARLGLPNVHVVSYECLVEDPTATVSAVLRHFQIDTSTLDPNTINHVRTDAINPAHFGDEKIRQTDSVHRRSIGTWRSVLKREEAELVAAYFSLDIEELPGAKGGIAQCQAKSLAIKLAELVSLRRLQSNASYEFEVTAPDMERRTRWLYKELFG
jgi:O-antigen biosynthesis protein